VKRGIFGRLFVEQDCLSAWAGRDVKSGVKPLQSRTRVESCAIERFRVVLARTQITFDFGFHRTRHVDAQTFRRRFLRSLFRRPFAGLRAFVDTLIFWTRVFSFSFVFVDFGARAGVPLMKSTTRAT
jgi:hypothetical protein